jgi:hypothetical protein
MPYPWLFERFTDGKIYTIPGGIYYIGDIFPRLKPEIYDELFIETGHKNGLYKCSEGIILVSEIAPTNGYEGTYRGSDDFEYVVNSGSIGIVNIELIKQESCLDGQLYNFPDGVNVIMDSGRFTFETDKFVLHIDTLMEGPEDDIDEFPDECPNSLYDIDNLCNDFNQSMINTMDIDT